MSYTLIEAEKKIKELLDKDINRQFTIKEIAKLTNHKEGYIRNILQTNKPLLLYSLIKKEKIGNLSFFSGIKKTFPTLLDYINKEIKSEDLKEVLFDIFANKFPLGIHYLQCHKRDLNLKDFYQKSKWRIQKGNKAKVYDLKGVERFGRTRILVFEGKTKGKTPTIQIIYSGTVGNEKHYLTEQTYPIWYQIVESNIKNLINANYKLDSFDITQMEMNIDFDIKKNSFLIINRIKNVKMRTLNDVIEIYVYESDDGTPKGRIGKKLSEIKEKMSKDLMAQKGIGDFLSYNQRIVEGVNLVIEQGKEVDVIKKQLNTMINQHSSSNGIMKEIIETYPKMMDNLLTESKSQHSFIGSELKLIRDDLKTYKTDTNIQFKKRKESEEALIKIVSNITQSVKDNSETAKNSLKLFEKLSDSSDLNYQQTLDLIKQMNTSSQTQSTQITQLTQILGNVSEILTNIKRSKYKRFKRRITEKEVKKK